MAHILDIAQVGVAVADRTRWEEFARDVLGFPTFRCADYAYLAAWKMPWLALVEKLEAAVEADEFHEYFEQINARGPLVAPPAVLEHMVNR